MGECKRQYTLEEKIEGKYDINESVSNFYMCSQCKNMKRIIDINKTKIGESFFIECGELAGEELVLTEKDISKLFLIKESPPLTVRKILSNPSITKLERCSAGCTENVCNVKNYNKMDYLGLDPYTNNLLINWFLNKETTNVIKMYIGFVCNNKGYSLYEYPNIGRIRHLQEYPEFLIKSNKSSPTAQAEDKVPLSKEVTKGIILQLFATLHKFRKYDFSHGNPCSRSILFKNDVCGYEYDGVLVESPITMKLCDLHNAGITVNNTRLYNKSVIADEEILRKNFKPVIETTTITPFYFKDNKINTDKITYYRLKDPNKYVQESILFMYIKHLGLPMYQSSFDAYAFMLSLMADRSFFATVMSDAAMYLLWRRMWLPEEFESVQDTVLKLHEKIDPVTRVEKVLRILAGFGLRCDMIDYGWDMIKKW